MTDDDGAQRPDLEKLHQIKDVLFALRRECNSQEPSPNPDGFLRYCTDQIGRADQMLDELAAMLGDDPDKPDGLPF